jgi:hypothetical protein
MLLVTISTSIDEKILILKRNKELSRNHEYLMRSFDWIGDKFLSNIQSLIPYTRTSIIEGMNKI